MQKKPEAIERNQDKLIQALLGDDAHHGENSAADADNEEATARTVLSVNIDSKRRRKETTIDNLPPECLIHCLAALPARDLLAAERVCQKWYRIVNDDASWQQAFYNNFNAHLAPGKRLSELSWRAEYILRTRLIGLWRHSSSKAKVADAKISHITHTACLDNGDCLASSTWSGRAVALNPQSTNNKRITRLSAFSNHPGAIEGDEVICSLITTDKTSVVWAMRSGNVCISSIRVHSNESLPLGRLAAMPCAICNVLESSNRVVVATIDGRLTTFDTATHSISWQSSQELQNTKNLPSVITRLAARNDLIVAGSADGDVFAVYTNGKLDIWRNWTSVESIITYISLFEQGVLIMRANETVCHWIPLDSGDHRISYEPKESIYGAVTAFHSEEATNLSSLEFGQRSYFIAGHACGAVNVWLHAKPDAPVRYLQSPGGYKITAIQTTNAFVLVGSVDGSIKVFEPLHGTVLRVLNDRSTPRHALRLISLGEMDERRWQVSAIAVDQIGSRVAAAVGERLFTWSSSVGNNSDALKKRKHRTGARISSRTEKFLDDLDLQEEIVELRSERQEDFQARLEEAAPSIRRQPLLESLSPDEAMQYARLLSLEEEEQRQLRLAQENAEIDHLLNDFSLTHENDVSFSIDDEGSTHSPSPLPSPALKMNNLPDLEDQAAWPIARLPHQAPPSPLMRPVQSSSWSAALKRNSPNALISPSLLPLDRNTQTRSTFEDDLELAIQLSLADMSR